MRTFYIDLLKPANFDKLEWELLMYNPGATKLIIENWNIICEKGININLLAKNFSKQILPLIETHLNQIDHVELLSHPFAYKLVESELTSEYYIHVFPKIVTNFNLVHIVYLQIMLMMKGFIIIINHNSNN